MSNLTATDPPALQSVWGALVSIIDKPRATFSGLVAQPRFNW